MLKRLALQVELALNVEELLPYKFRRRFIIGGLSVSPNRAINPLEAMRRLVIRPERYNTAESIDEALHPPLVRDHRVVSGR